jgi:hypothetical protein
MVRRDHVEPGARELPVELEPRAGAAGGVQEQDRLARAAAEQVHPPSGQLQVLPGWRIIWHGAASYRLPIYGDPYFDPRA